MFARKLVSAFALLALFAAVYGASAWWIAAEAEHRVLRGRVAADLYRGAVVLEVETATLLALVRGSLGDDGDGAPDPVPTLASLDAKLAVLRDLALSAARMDAERAKPPEEHVARERLLSEIDDALARLRESVVEASGGTAEGELDRWFGTTDALAQRIAPAVAFEAQAVERERAVADDGLERVRVVALAAMVAFCALAAALAIFLYGLMRRPLAELTEGLRAFEAERLEVRIPERRADEFGLLAASANRMAARLQAARAADAALRRSLEERVAERTERLQQAVGALEDADRRRQQLLADIGHELRTPATVIRGEAEVALRTKEGDVEHYRRALERIVDGTRQLARVVDDLLVVARDDPRGLRIDVKPLDANDVLRRMLPPTGLPADRLRVRIEGEAPVLADAMRLRQVIGILLDNAVRYAPGADQVGVTARVVDEAWRLEITDGGIGLEPDERERVFERGYRGRAARRLRADGSGLGLPIARLLVERLGGTLTLESEGAGRGATALLVLPLERAGADRLEEAS